MKYILEHCIGKGSPVFLVSDLLIQLSESALEALSFYYETLVYYLELLVLFVGSVKLMSLFTEAVAFCFR